MFARTPRILTLISVALTLVACSADTIATGPVDASEIAARIADGNAPVILDVRTPEEYAEGHVPGAINIPHDAVADHLGKLPFAKDDEVAVYCGTGRRAGLAEEALVEAGFTNVRDLTGHYKAWIAESRPIETE